MTDSVRIFHNPRCSKSRATKTLLEENGVATNIVEYLKTPPTVDELDTILKLLSMEPRDLMRKQESAYKENNLGAPELSREQLIQAMVDHPILIERPIVVRGNKATIGRPPENVLDLIK
jgi:arsenate reductase